MVQFGVIGVFWLYFAEGHFYVWTGLFLNHTEKPTPLSGQHMIMPPPPQGTSHLLPTLFSRFTHFRCKIVFLPNTFIHLTIHLERLLLATDAEITLICLLNGIAEQPGEEA